MLFLRLAVALVLAGTFGGALYLLSLIAGELTRWRLTQPQHRAVEHDLFQLQRIESGDLRIEDATFEARGPDGILVDDPDAATVAKLEDYVRRHPPHRPRWP